MIFIGIAVWAATGFTPLVGVGLAAASYLF